MKIYMVQSAQLEGHALPVLNSFKLSSQFAVVGLGGLD